MIPSSNSSVKRSGTLNHYGGDLLHTMRISKLSHMRTEAFQLLVIPSSAPLLAEVMKTWHSATLYGKPEDYVFASCKLGGRKPRTGSMIVEDYLRPAAIKAKVIALDDKGKTFDLDGNSVRRFGFHVFRHSLCSFLMAEGENPAVIQATLRHTRLDMTMLYAHSRKKQRLEAQGRVLEAVLRGERGLQRGPEAVQ